VCVCVFILQACDVAISTYRSLSARSEEEEEEEEEKKKKYERKKENQDNMAALLPRDLTERAVELVKRRTCYRYRYGYIPLSP
jgi:predicted RNA-binding protein with RPS1 domain